jgi:hypothetical protein
VGRNNLKEKKEKIYGDREGGEDEQEEMEKLM